MKTTDLMIGDWVDVYHELPDESGFYKPLQVTGIHQNDGVCFGHSAIECPWIDPEEFEEAVEPIPLTPEILEKNGFHAYSDMSQEWFIGVFRDGNKYFELTYSKGDIDWTINGDEYCIAPIKYVHELQHALRLCGIENEIIL